MATISSNTSLVISPAAPTIETVAVSVLPLSANAIGTGRLTHPTLGILDYPYAPDAWEGVDTDLLIAPIWASTTTLSGVANTLWAGSVKDSQPVERWTSDISMPMIFVRALLNFWMNPPAPETGYITWAPSYVNEHRYKVILLSVGSSGGVLTMDYISRQGWLAGELELKMRVVDRA